MSEGWVFGVIEKPRNSIRKAEGSLGYGAVFRKTLALEGTVFAAFFAATFVVLYGWFLALRRAYQADLLSGR